MKIYAVFGLIIAALAAAGTGLMYKVEALEAEKALLTSANESYLSAINHLDEEIKVRENALRARETRIQGLDKELDKRLDELDEIRNSQTITEKERECLNSDIPPAILDSLRQQTHNTRGSAESLPTSITVHRNAKARAKWFHLVRSHKVHAAVTDSYRRTRCG